MRPWQPQQLQRLDRSGLPALGSFEAHEYPKPLPWPPDAFHLLGNVLF